jgi:protein-disulfide isomerase
MAKQGKYTMASSQKKNQPAVSEKQALKQRQAARKKQAQRQQQIILAVLAVALLVGVLLIVFLQTRPVEAIIPDTVMTRYSDFTSKNLVGVTPEGYPYLGAADAPVLMEEIASFSCPFCKAYHDGTVVSILDEIKAGRVKYVYIPVTSIGDYEVNTATEAALCAAQQNKFWEMNDILFDWQGRYAAGTNDGSRLANAAGQIGLDMGKYNACMGSSAPKDTIAKGEEAARTRGLTGTPTIYIDGQQIQPALNGGNPPSVSELRGLIESKAAAKK